MFSMRRDLAVCQWRVVGQRALRAAPPGGRWQVTVTVASRGKRLTISLWTRVVDARTCHRAVTLLPMWGYRTVTRGPTAGLGAVPTAIAAPTPPPVALAVGVVSGGAMAGGGAGGVVLSRELRWRTWRRG